MTLSILYNISLFLLSKLLITPMKHEFLHIKCRQFTFTTFNGFEYGLVTIYMLNAEPQFRCLFTTECSFLLTRQQHKPRYKLFPSGPIKQSTRALWCYTTIKDNDIKIINVTHSRECVSRLVSQTSSSSRSTLELFVGVLKPVHLYSFPGIWT